MEDKQKLHEVVNVNLIDQIKVRPVTPVCALFPRDDVVKDAKDDNLEKRLQDQKQKDKKKIAIILLQRLIRGRAK